MGFLSRRLRQPRIPKPITTERFNASQPAKQISLVRQWVNYWRTYRYRDRMQGRRVQYKMGKTAERAKIAQKIWEQMKRINELQHTGVGFRMEILDKIKQKWKDGKLTNEQFWIAWRAASEKLQGQIGVQHYKLVDEFKTLRNLIDEINR